MLQKLPLGIQNLKEIISENLLYVDKTKYIYELINSSKYYFLSRPRRFGKSLLLDTIAEVFLGSKELFKGLAIYDQWNWQEKYPVIRIDFTQISYETKEQFKEMLISCLKNIANNYKIQLSYNSIRENIQELITKLSEQYQKVVLLVDEYDKPIVDYIEDIPKAIENREVLKEFFSSIKSLDASLKFVFITGVSKFAKVSLFSGLNNLLDITFDERFAKICGITSEELEKYFVNYQREFAKKFKVSLKEGKELIKKWYNGYSWNDGKDRVYNPFSLLNLFISYRLKNYWLVSGTPTFLVKLFKQRNINVAELSNYKINEFILESYDIENLATIPLLLQTGYLTIKDSQFINNYYYILDYPNYEVKESLLLNLLGGYSEQEVYYTSSLVELMKENLKTNNLAEFLEQIKKLFAGIPYNLQAKQNESYYHSLFYMMLSLMGAKIDLEVLTDKGRIDGVLETTGHLYIIEFKLGKAADAMEQIKEKKYWEKYLLSKTLLNQNKEIYLLAIGGFQDKDIEMIIEVVK